MTSTLCRYGCLYLLLLVLLMLGSSPRLAAQQPDREVQPQRNAQGKLLRHGYRVWVQRTRRENGGYMPIRVQIQAVPPLLTDSVVTVEVDDHFANWSGGALLVEQDATLPAGQATPVDIDILLPALKSDTQFEVRVWIDGELERGLSVFLPNHSSHLQSNTHVVSTVQNEWMTHRLSIPGGSARFREATLESFPQTWLGHTSYDIVHMRLEHLKELSAKYPQACKALADWVASGGNLWIDQTGADFEKLPQLDQLLCTPIPPERPPAAPPSQRAKGPFANEGYLADDPRGHPYLNPRANFEPIEIAPFDPPFRSEADRALASIRSKRIGFGMVVVFRDSAFEVVSQVSRKVVPDFAEPARLDWAVRNGVEPFDDDHDFWDWLIPGVGLPPVLAFQILITLFVIGIGPLNYFLLRRKRRLYLLVITVPLSALVITGGLIGYAVLADGFYVRVRARSFTELDQRSGQAACWSRQTYYAGIAPSDGLHFPTDMAVLPKEVGVHYRQQSREASRVLKWGEDQHLAEGWLRSRTTAQFMCIRARQSNAALLVASTPGQPPTVTNQLGSRIVQLVLCDAAGQYFAGTNIDERATTSLDAAPSQTVAAAARLSILETQPQALGAIQSYPNYPSAHPSTGFPSLLEASMEEVRMALGGNLDLAPNSYIAIVEKSPEVVYGCSARQEDSVHVVRGRW